MKLDFSKKSEQWFIDRVGKIITAQSSHAFNGLMEVTDRTHAMHLYNVAQNYQGYTFSDSEIQQKIKTL